MSLWNIDDEREVVPRWRSFQDTVSSGSLYPLSAPPKNDPGALSAVLAEEFHRSPDVYVAADYLSALITLRDFSAQFDVVTGYLQQQVDPEEPLAAFTTRAILMAHPASFVDSDTFTEHPRVRRGRRIASLRQRIRSEPSNAVARVDLALEQLIDGNQSDADRQIRTAVQLAPNNRFVLRAATRFRLSTADPDQAVRMLTRAPLTDRDPWLLASLIAAAQIAGSPTPQHRRAREMLSSGHFAPRDISELASELGTLEVHAGRDRRARALFEQSLAEPNENTIAQAGWAANAVGMRMDTGLLQVDRGFEARARASARASDWDNATTEGMRWLQDEPFAVEPAVNTSYAAAFGLEDFRSALKITEQSLRIHPDDSSLRNNAAYAAANLGRLDLARDLTRGSIVFDDSNGFNAFQATRGLIAFREGDAAQGRVLYQSAVEGFGADQPHLVAMALGLWAIEEQRLGTAWAKTVTNEAFRANRHADHPDADLVIQRLLAISTNPRG